jgi:glycosyltransferase involved in cell wall biosynthesis
MNRIARNEPCPCGSGQRYKSCCGRLEAGTSLASKAAGPSLDEAMQKALSAQQARRLDEAEALYRRALQIAPQTPDALHMLGVIRYEQGDYVEAKALICQALDLTGWQYPSYRHNLGLVVARAHAAVAGARVALMEAQYRLWSEVTERQGTEPEPAVTIVVPAYNHDRYVEAALDSIYRQTYRKLEVVVIDDGSGDATAGVVRRMLEHCPFPSHFVSRPNRGAVPTLNEAIELAGTPYVNVLNSDDLLLPERVERMVGTVAASGAQWGFSGVRLIDGLGRDGDLLKDSRAYQIVCALGKLPLARTVGFGLLDFNVAVSSGNLFFTKALWRSIGGFRDFRYNHDWDFALRALWVAEPRFVPQPLYGYRLHGANTITESSAAPRQEAHRVVADYLTRAIEKASPPNAFAPAVASWGNAFVVAVLEGGLAEALPVEGLKRLMAAVEHEPA